MSGAGFRVNGIFVFLISSVPDFIRMSIISPGLDSLDFCVYGTGVCFLNSNERAASAGKNPS